MTEERTAAIRYDLAAHGRPEIEARRQRVFRDPLGPTAYLFLRVLFQRTAGHTQCWLFQPDALPRAVLAVMAHCAYKAAVAAHYAGGRPEPSHDEIDNLVAAALGLVTVPWQSPALNRDNLLERNLDAWGTLTSLSNIIGVMAEAIARMGIDGVLRFDRSDTLRNAAQSLNELALAVRPTPIDGHSPALPI